MGPSAVNNCLSWFQPWVDLATKHCLLVWTMSTSTSASLSTRAPQGGHPLVIWNKVKLDIWPHDPKSIGFLLSLCTTYVWSLQVIQAKVIVCTVPKRFHSQMAKVDLDLWPQIHRVPPLIVNNLWVKIESDRVNVVVCIMPTRFTDKGPRAANYWSPTRQCDQMLSVDYQNQKLVANLATGIQG